MKFKRGERKRCRGSIYCRLRSGECKGKVVLLELLVLFERFRLRKSRGGPRILKLFERFEHRKLRGCFEVSFSLSDSNLGMPWGVVLELLILFERLEHGKYIGLFLGLEFPFSLSDSNLGIAQG
jgi:hypothetical protein